MNFLSYEALKEFHGVLPLYLLQRSDIENPKFGVDSVFYKEDHYCKRRHQTQTRRKRHRHYEHLRLFA